MKMTPSITELQNIGFKTNEASPEYVQELYIKECNDTLYLRKSIYGGWFWSITDTNNEPNNCQPLKRMSQIFSLINILKGL